MKKNDSVFVVENFKKLRKKWNFEPKICLHVVLTLYYQPMQTEILKIDESQDIFVLKSKVRPLIHVFVVENFKKLRKNEILNPKFVYT